MTKMKTNHWQDDLRCWLRQQQAWNQLRNLQREGGKEVWERLVTWPKILGTSPCHTAPVKPGGAVEYHVMCHNGDWLLAVWMLKSLLVQLPEKPQVIIHIESSLRPSSLAKLQYHFPEARIIQPEEGKPAAAQMLLSQGLSHCLHWLHCSRIMYKLFAAQTQSASTNIIGLDPDILFFDAPQELIAVSNAPLPDFTFQQDEINGYALSLEEAKTTLGINLIPKINTGIILRAKAALELQRVEALLQSPSLNKTSGHLEQTLYALCASEGGSVRFLPSSYALSMGANIEGTDRVCRHYAGASKRYVATEGMRRLIKQGLLEKLRG